MEEEMAQRNSRALRAGLAQVDITPPLGTPMAGYIRRQGPAAAVSDPLWAKALYLDDGHFAVALVVLDILLVDQHLLRLVRERVEQISDLSGEQVLIAATHTHSGPSGLGVLSFGGGHDQVLLTRTVPQIADCVVEARRNSFTAVLKSGSTMVSGFSQCRLDPQRPIAPRLHMLRIEDTDGRLKGILANFACHPTLLSYDSLQLSADWVGAACQLTTQALGEEVVVILSNGASGDIHPLYLSQTVTDLQRLGQILGGAMVSLAGQLWAAGESLQAHNMRWGVRLKSSPGGGRRIERPRLRLIEKQIELPLRTYLAAEEYESAIEEVASRLQEKGVLASDVTAMIEHPGYTMPCAPELDEALLALLARLNTLAGERLERSRVLNLFPDSSHQSFPVYLLQIDDELAFVFFPGELANGIGVRLEEESRFKELVVVSYANDYIGYLVSEADYPAGGYDVGVSHFPASSESLFVRAVLELLAGLYGPVKPAAA